MSHRVGFLAVEHGEDHVGLIRQDQVAFLEPPVGFFI